MRQVCHQCRTPVHVAAGDEAVLCPVCKSAHLAQRHGRLVCPAEGWQLSLAAESLTLTDLKARLAAAYEVGGWACGCRKQKTRLIR
jgi:LSD1 subclass zinc finger protein